MAKAKVNPFAKAAKKVAAKKGAAKKVGKMPKGMTGMMTAPNPFAKKRK